MDLNNVDWSAYWDQAVQYWDLAQQSWAQMSHNCDQLTHWLLNDGSSFTAFLVFVLICCTVVAYSARGHKKQLAERRAGYDEDRFVREMAEAGHDSEVAHTVYQYIEDMHRIDFPILPSDDLYTVLGITDDAVRRAMPMLLEAMGRQAQIGRLMKPLTTVEDLVKFVANAPRATEYVWELQTA
ncbi:MAG TPA: hypothetical protein VNU94_05965 [Acidobacteriaceae bacterium]|jgi:hypothetical protein|nr:hypothetical protein [Acidobacteriaceae bacterium]